jgi:zinc transport system substrate-binding protein
MCPVAVTRHWLSWILICVVLRPAPGLADDAPLQIVVSILPEKYFVERVGGEGVAVSVMVGPGRSPATYEPTPRQLAHLSQARLYFRIGVAFEDTWMSRIRAANPQMKVIDLERGIKLRDIDSVGARKAAAAGGRAKDPHVWTDPRLVKIMAAHIRDALIESNPGHRAEYESHYRAFAADLDRLDHWIRDLFQGLTSHSFMVFHPSWGYFADAYGLQQIPIESAGKEPGPKTLSTAIDQGRKAHVKVIFVQQQFSRSAAETVAQAIGATVVTVDPLAEDYLDNMRHVARAFVEALKH